MILRIALCEGLPCDWIKCFRPFSGVLQPSFPISISISISIQNYLFTNIPSAKKSNTTKRKDTKRKNPRANGIADFPGSRVLSGFQLIKCVFSFF